MATENPLRLKSSNCGSCDDESLNNVSSNNKLLTTIFLILAVSTAFTITLFLFLWHYDVSIKINIVSKKQQVSTSDERASYYNSLRMEPSASLENLTIIPREVWGGQPPTHPFDPLPTPVPYIIIHFTATKNCSSSSECMHYVRIIQTLHIRNRKWWDIGYNFLIGGDGQVYEGRGWENMGAHTKSYNSKSIGIAFIGIFNDDKPPEKQLDACRGLIVKGVEMGYVDKDYKLFGARQLQAPVSPGDALYEEIKTWKHWTKSVK